MIKYSLQNECLENIEAFSDEQMSSDMAVIESVLDIFDKTILMMELSNEPVDIPDVSMFMESAFFQEENEGEQQAADGDTGDGEASNTAPASDQSSNNNNSSSDNNTQNNTMSDADRKAYNKEHWVRMKNKKGNLENIFISIIAFIPRLLGFLIQSIVRLFKKIFDKDTNQKANECAKTTPEQRQEIVKELGTDTVSDDAETSETSEASNKDNSKNDTIDDTSKNAEPASPGGTPAEDNKKKAGSVNVKDMTTESFYNKSVQSALQEFLKIIDKLDVSKTLTPVENIENPYAYYANAFIKLQSNIKNDLETAKQSLENSLKMDLVEIPIGDQYQNAFTNLRQTLSNIEQGADRVNKVYIDIVDKLKNANVPSVQGDAVNENMKNVNAAIAPLKDLLNQMKIMIKNFSIRTKNFAAEYAVYSKNVTTIWNVLNKNSPQQNQSQQSQAQPQPDQPQQPAVNNGGGENNGGQNQNI